MKQKGQVVPEKKGPKNVFIYFLITQLPRQRKYNITKLSEFP